MVWSQEFDTNNHTNYEYRYKSIDHPKHIDFTVDEVVMIGHDSGTAGTHWYVTIEKNVGNGRTRRFYGIGIHVANWCKLFKREIMVDLPKILLLLCSFLPIILWKSFCYSKGVGYNDYINSNILSSKYDNYSYDARFCIAAHEIARIDYFYALNLECYPITG